MARFAARLHLPDSNRETGVSIFWLGNRGLQGEWRKRVSTLTEIDAVERKEAALRDGYNARLTSNQAGRD